MKIQHTLDIAAPPSRVWELTIDVESLPDHTPTMSSVTLLDPAPVAVGSTARIKQPGQRAKVWTVTQVEPNKRFSWNTTSSGMVMTASHDLVETPTGTTNTLTVEMDGLLAPVLGLLLRWPIGRAIAAENEGFKAAAESPAGGSSSHS